MVIVELKDGKVAEGKLAGTFRPADQEITLLATNRVKRVFHFSSLCCVLLDEMVDGVAPVPGQESLEVVECVNGKRYQVNCPEDCRRPEGFFAFPNENENRARVLFFVDSGIRYRAKFSPAGSIIEEQGDISDADLEQVLDEQRRMKEQHLEQDVIDQMISMARREGRVGRWLRLGDILVKSGLVTRQQVEEALDGQKKGERKRIGRLLVDRGLVTEKQVLAALSVKFSLPFIDLSNVAPDNKALASISLDLVMQLKIFPIADRGDFLEIATSRPTDPSISDTLRFHTNRQIRLTVATPEQIDECIRKYYASVEDGLKDLIENISSKEEKLPDERDTLAMAEGDSELIRLVNRVLVDGHQRGASDIHIEPGVGQMSLGVRYRIDGICQTRHMLPASLARSFIARLKILAGLDIAEHRKAQSGKFMLRFRGERVEYRLEITPTVGGREDAVLRILAGGNFRPIPVTDIGLAQENLGLLQDLVKKPYGLILCVGPTGSGKTTTLHALLGRINTPERKIWTVEDPVEITQLGLRQVEVRPKIGFTFQQALRSLLRADPDVVMIGEMRDREAAHTAIEASLTGHLVLSTLHTNTAAETVTRLIEMGEEPFNLADSLLGILAQRLARKLCTACRESFHPERREHEELVEFYGRELYVAHGHPGYSRSFRLMRSRGCEQCGGTGYKGRIGIHELLICSEPVREVIKRQGSVAEIHRAAVIDGMRTLRMDGVAKILAGETDLAQVQRVCL